MIPLFRWVGSKRALADRIVSVMPDDFARYHEPFAGSAAVFFELRERGWVGKSYLSDMNAELINFWRVVASDVGAKPPRRRAIHAIGNLVKFGTDLDTYRMVRAAEFSDPVRRAARFWYLQATCFNGLWRVNSDGGHNVPHGDRDPHGPDYYDFDTAHGHLCSTTLTVTDALRALDDVRRGDVVYLDPPYADTFTDYTIDNWTPLHLAELIGRAQQLASRGAYVILSERDTPLLQEMLRGRALAVASVSVRDNVAASAAARGERREVIAVFAPLGRKREVAIKMLDMVRANR